MVSNEYEYKKISLEERLYYFSSQTTLYTCRTEFSVAVATWEKVHSGGGSIELTVYLHLFLQQTNSYFLYLQTPFFNILHDEITFKDIIFIVVEC